MIQKSYDKTPTLYLIPTPIGNLDDITIRAINTLREVDIILAEDTRIANQLCKHLGINKKIISNHQHNELKNKERVIEYLKSGKSVGLISDRGTPVISDPGYEIVKEVIEQGYNVVGLPGPTALIPALIVSGLNPLPFAFFGFLNSKESKRKKELKEIKKLPVTIIIYEAPHRIKETLENIYEILGNRRISISREISKRYEDIYRGTVKEVLDELGEVRGEIVVVIEGSNDNEKGNTFENLTIIEHVHMYIKEGYDSKEAIKLVAKDRDISKKEVYNIYHNIEKGD